MTLEQYIIYIACVLVTAVGLAMVVWLLIHNPSKEKAAAVAQANGAGSSRPVFSEWAHAINDARIRERIRVRLFVGLARVSPGLRLEDVLFHCHFDGKGDYYVQLRFKGQDTVYKPRTHHRVQDLVNWVRIDFLGHEWLMDSPTYQPPV